MRTATPQRSTPTPHIADFRLRTGITRAVWSFDTDLALVLIMNTDQRTVSLHGLCHFVPVCCVQRGGGRPAADRAVGVAGRVLELIDCQGGLAKALEVIAELQTWSSESGVEFRERVYVSVEGICLHDVEGVGVNYVHTEAGVEIRERRDGGANPARC